MNRQAQVIEPLAQCAPVPCFVSDTVKCAQGRGGGREDGCAS